MNVKEQTVSFDAENEGNCLTAEWNSEDTGSSGAVGAAADEPVKKRFSGQKIRDAENARYGKTIIPFRTQKEQIVVKRKPFYDFIKRVFDIFVALICLTAGLPVYLILILAIVIDDPGNPFFVQERTGFNGRVFRMVKLRTMYRDADRFKSELMIQNEYESVHFKMHDDPRVTRVGRFLRATSLDETAQVINLLLSDMTVVGPRAFLPSEQARLPEDRLQVKPGLTCYWQITDTTKMSYEDQLELDYRYIRERGILTDLKLIGKTIRYILRGGNC